MLADATRVRLLWALLDGELPVNSLARAMDKSPAGVSQHLAKLRMARLVRTRRQGTQVFYRIQSPHTCIARGGRRVPRRACRRWHTGASPRRPRCYSIRWPWRRHRSRDRMSSTPPDPQSLGEHRHGAEQLCPRGLVSTTQLSAGAVDHSAASSSTASW